MASLADLLRMAQQPGGTDWMRQMGQAATTTPNYQAYRATQGTPEWMRQMGQGATTTPGAQAYGSFRSMMGGDAQDASLQYARQLGGYHDPTSVSAFINGAGGPADLMRQQIAGYNQQAQANKFTPYQSPWQGQLNSQFNSLMSNPGLWSGMQSAVAGRQR